MVDKPKIPECPNFATHLKLVLGQNVGYELWPNHRNLPLLLRAQYKIWTGIICDHTVLFIVDQFPEGPTPAQVAAHVKYFQDYFNGPVVYVRDHMSALYRIRLIKNRVAFIIPERQIYLPPLGIDLREQFPQPLRQRDVLTPGSQFLLLAILLDLLPEEQERVPTILAKRFGYGAMTMVRAFKELQLADLVTTRIKGRRRILVIQKSLADIWDLALPRLQSPILHTHLVFQNTQARAAPMAGLTAFARQTTIADDGPLTVAVDQQGWRQLHFDGFAQEAAPGDPDTMLIQVWSYNPQTFARDGMVDPLSLAISLRDDMDDRTQIAWRNLVKDMPW